MSFLSEQLFLSSALNKQSYVTLVSIISTLQNTSLQCVLLYMQSIFPLLPISSCLFTCHFTILDDCFRCLKCVLLVPKGPVSVPIFLLVGSRELLC